MEIKDIEKYRLDKLRWTFYVKTDKEKDKDIEKEIKGEWKMNEKDKDYIERDFTQEELYGSDEPPLKIRCELCDEDILIGESYHTDINGYKYCSLECLLEMYEVEEKILNENDFSI